MLFVVFLLLPPPPPPLLLLLLVVVVVVVVALRLLFLLLEPLLQLLLLLLQAHRRCLQPYRFVFCALRVCLKAERRPAHAWLPLLHLLPHQLAQSLPHPCRLTPGACERAQRLPL